MRQIYLIATIVGAIGPWVFFGQYIIAQGGFPLMGFIDAITVDAPTTGVTVDLLIASIVLWIWSFVDARRLGILTSWAGWGWVIPVNLMIGLSCALPLYLYLRERRREAAD